MKLSTDLEQLLQLKGPNPPPPPLSRLNAILKSTQLDTKNKNVETAWLVLTVRHRGRWIRGQGETPAVCAAEKEYLTHHCVSIVPLFSSHSHQVQSKLRFPTFGFGLAALVPKEAQRTVQN